MGTNNTIAAQHYKASSHPSVGKTSTSKMTLARLVGGAVIAAGAAITGAAVLSGLPMAHADVVNDAVFVQVLREEGIYNIYGPQQMIAMGHGVCADLDNGDTSYGAILMIARMNPMLGNPESGYFVGAATAAYCPWDKNPGFASTGSADIGFIGPNGATTSPIPLAQCPSGYYQNSYGTCVERPNQNPNSSIAVCCDGTYSHSQHKSGTCSSHGGVCQWNSLNPGYSDKPGSRSADMQRRWA
jgi:hypothetical protein